MPFYYPYMDKGGGRLEILWKDSIIMVGNIQKGMNMYEIYFRGIDFCSFGWADWWLRDSDTRGRGAGGFGVGGVECTDPCVLKIMCRGSRVGRALIEKMDGGNVL